MRTGYFLSLIPASLLLSVTCASAAPIGTVVDVSTRVTGSGTGGNREIIPQSSIYLYDNLNANSSGNAQIKFIDGTKLVVGPGALITIDELLYSGEKTFKKLTISAIQGTFRFVTGNSNKQAYQINTPVGTMGVRGTAFDVTVVNSQTHVTVTHGTVRLCASAGSCRELTGKCSYAVMNRSGISLKGDLRERSMQEKDFFPLLANQSRLNVGFRHLGGSCTTAAFKMNPAVPKPEIPSIQKANAVVNPTPPVTNPNPPVTNPNPPTGNPPQPGNSHNRSGKADNSNPGNGNASGNNQGTNNPNNSGNANGNGRGSGQGNGNGNGNAFGLNK